MVSGVMTLPFYQYGNILSNGQINGQIFLIKHEWESFIEAILRTNKLTRLVVIA